MKPADLRNATFHSLVGGLSRQRLEVWRAWSAHGPGTTRAIAARAGMDILSFRPRSTELYQLGLLELLCDETAGHEGVYRARTNVETDRWLESRKREGIQLPLC